MDSHRGHLLLLLIATCVVAGCLAIGAFPSSPGLSISSASAAARTGRRHGSSTPTAPAVAVGPTNGDQYLFWRGPDGHIYDAWYGSRWHGPIRTSWRSASAPTVDVTASGHRYVFWQGPNGHIYETWYVGRWHGPKEMAWLSSSAPSAAVANHGHQYVFWRGDNGRIDEAWFNGRWHGPIKMGWSSASAPAVAATDDARQYVFWRGTNGHLYTDSDEKGWKSPEELPWTSSSAPSAVAVHHGQQYLFWRGAGERIYEAWYSGGWHGPVNEGWTSRSAPSVGASDFGRQYLFWQGLDGDIWEDAYYGGWLAAVDRDWRMSHVAAKWPYVQVVQTTPTLSQRLTQLPDVRFRGSPPTGLQVIDVDDRARYQRVSGVGAAMTDSSAWLIYDELQPSVRAAVMDELFGVGGIHLSLALLPMGASDFTRTGQPYTYDDMPPGNSDPQLTRFSIAHDRAYIIPALRQMLATNPHTGVFATPWSAPAWMKANQSLDDTDDKGTLLSSDYQAFATYFVKFIRAYDSQHVPIVAVAPENEPNAGAAFPAMFFPASSEAQWIANNLEPTLRQASLHPEIYGGDVGWGSPSYPDALLSSQARSELSGIAWHCYSGSPTVMGALESMAPALDQVVTECARELEPFPVPVVVIASMRNWASAVALWNLALDPSGGPVQPPNSGCQGCTGLIRIDERTHTVGFSLAYYQLGQIGRYVAPGAWRVGSNDFVNYTSSGATAGIDDVAFENPNGSRVLVAYNNSAGTARFAVEWSGHSFTYSLPPQATVTFTWKP